MSELILFFLLVAATLSIATSAYSACYFNKILPFLVDILDRVNLRFDDEESARTDAMASNPRPAAVIAYGTGVALIQGERDRQIRFEGYTPEHDDAHVNAELRRAAAAYILPWSPAAEEYWPFESYAYAPTGAARGADAIRDLVKAGALIAAEIDRLQRIEGRKQRKEAV